MKKIFQILLFLVCCINIAAQKDENQQYLLTNRSSTFGFSLSSTIDPYLSPMVYSGIGLRYDMTSRRYLSDKNTNYSRQSKFSLSTKLLLNPAFSSEMLFGGINYGWGINYHVRINKRLKILAGGLWDIDFGFKNIPRNINNPINLDMATNLNLTGLFLFDLPTRRNVLHFQLALQTPIFGYMFVPYGGASYYDMFQLGATTNAFHLSSLHNKIGLNQTYSVDVPFNRTTWRFGLNFQNLKYKANNLVFKQNEMSIIVGTTFDAFSFAGKKKIAPSNFKSIND